MTSTEGQGFENREVGKATTKYQMPGTQEIPRTQQRSTFHRNKKKGMGGALPSRCCQGSREGIQDSSRDSSGKMRNTHVSRV